jgi:hypothetical protein
MPPQPRRACERCGATLSEDQGWCLQCGAGAPGSLDERPDWRPLATIAAATAILLGGAGAAAYAALSQPVHRAPLHVVLASVPPPAASAPATPTTPLPSTPLPSTPTPTTPATGLGGATGSALPPVSTKPPKIPALAPTPTTPSTPNTGGSTTSTPTNTTGATTPAPATPAPILLDTNAAATYNPYNYPAETFGDPSLAIDGETETGWIAKVIAASAPRMAAGIAIDLHSARRLGSMEIDTTSPGTSIEIYGANGSAPPATITDPGWTKLNAGHVLKKRKATLKLHSGSASYRFVVVWLTKAPAGAKVVSLNELSLFAPAK